MILPLKKMCDIKQLIIKKHIKHLALDSRQVKPNSLFIALKGSKFDGNDYIEVAKASGASLILSDNINVYSARNNIYYVAELKTKLPEIINLIYVKQPQKLFAVTGTNGKSSIVDLLRQSFLSLGINITTIGTIGVYQNNSLIEELTNTTPDICKFYALLAEYSDNYFAFEASSHGLVQQRFGDLKLDYAIFTNLTRDHLDYHQNMQNYFAAKLKLFTNHLKDNGTAIVNIDDKYGQKIRDICRKKNIKIFTYGSNKADLCLVKSHNTDFIVRYQNNEYLFKTKLVGAFQIYNILAVISLLLHHNFAVEQIATIVNKLKPIRGRLDEIEHNKDFRVFIDYAHTPDALKNILMTLSEFCKAKLILVFGCGGDRDKGKRGQMAKIADQYADITIVTDDNPRTEDASLIRAEITKDIKQYYDIAERELAIAKAINIAESGDIIVIAGKGHENYQIIGTEQKIFSDYEVAAKILNAN
ncbi:MAG: UDP-N-acetylmuramoyl-L-alanyl-D-glutamate--2,6-diaminopimelate ligase [Rickettsiales bacterium]